LEINRNAGAGEHFRAAAVGRVGVRRGDHGEAVGGTARDRLVVAAERGVRRALAHHLRLSNPLRTARHAGKLPPPKAAPPAIGQVGTTFLSAGFLFTNLIL
jgi:hypothetical protein